MNFYKNLLFFSFLFIAFAYGCNNKPKTDIGENRNRVIKVESSIIDSIKHPYIELTYNDDGFLEKSVTTIYKTLSNGKTKLLNSRTCNYTHYGNKITISGVNEKIDSISDEVTVKDIRIELEIGQHNRIIKRTDYKNDFNEAPLIDTFEWNDDKIIKKKRYLEGVTQDGLFESITEYSYKDGNLVEGITCFIVEINDVRTSSKDTIKCEYDTTLPNHYTIQFPNEYELSYNDISFFPIRCSKNLTSSISYTISLTQNIISENSTNFKTRGEYAVLSTFTLDENERILTRTDTGNSYQEINNIVDPLQNKKMTNEYEIKLYYTYK